MVLTGLMGAGKSTIGRRLAERLQLSFIDTDDAITAHTGQRISDLFRTCGESGFRQIERQVVKALLRDRQDTVVSLGGGAFAQPEIREACQRSGARTVWLRVEPELALSRISDAKGDEPRPLLAHENPLATLIELLRKRSAGYAEAEFHVDTDQRTIDDVVEEIVHALS